MGNTLAKVASLPRQFPLKSNNVWFCTIARSLQVVGAKVVTNAKSPGARCYGFVTMATIEEATKCVSHLHRTELHGKMISVERVSVVKKGLCAFMCHTDSYRSVGSVMCD